MNEFILQETSLRIFIKGCFEQMRHEDPYYEDGATFESYLGSYLVTWRHHIKVRYERGGDSYCGVWEMVGRTTDDHIEFIDAIDERDDCPLPGVVAKLNEYAKEYNLKER